MAAGGFGLAGMTVLGREEGWLWLIGGGFWGRWWG